MLDRLRRSYEILEWPDRFGGRHYPRWQFDPKWRVLSGVRDVLRIFRSRDALYVTSQFILRRNGRPSLLQLIRRRRAKRAAELARTQVHATEVESALTPRWRKEITRRVLEMTDPTRHVIASCLTRRGVMVYDLENNCYGWGHVSNTSLVKDRGVAQAVARHLSAGQKRTDVQVLRVRSGAKTVRALEKARPAFGRRSFLPKFTTGRPTPTFVPITQPGDVSVWLIRSAVRAGERGSIAARLSGQPRAAPNAVRCLSSSMFDIAIGGQRDPGPSLRPYDQRFHPTANFVLRCGRRCGDERSPMLNPNSPDLLVTQLSATDSRLMRR